MAKHELGHAMGLGHVNDANHVMFQGGGTRINFGDGDLRGLALLGSGPCAPQL